MKFPHVLFFKFCIVSREQTPWEYPKRNVSNINLTINFNKHKISFLLAHVFLMFQFVCRWFEDKNVP